MQAKLPSTLIQSLFTYVQAKETVRNIANTVNGAAGTVTGTAGRIAEELQIAGSLLQQLLGTVNRHGGSNP